MFILKNTKHIGSLVVGAVLLVLSSSCEDIIEIDPVSAIPDAVFWQNNEDAE